MIGFVARVWVNASMSRKAFKDEKVGRAVADRNWFEPDWKRLGVKPIIEDDGFYTYEYNYEDTFSVEKLEGNHAVEPRLSHIKVKYDSKGFLKYHERGLYLPSEETKLSRYVQFSSDRDLQDDAQIDAVSDAT